MKNPCSHDLSQATIRWLSSLAVLALGLATPDFVISADSPKEEQVIRELVQIGAIIKRFEVREIETSGLLVRLKAEHLDAKGCVTSEVLVRIAQIPDLSLELRSLPLTDEGLVKLLQQSKPIGLDVSGSQLTSRALNSLAKAEQLRLLDLSFSRIGDENLERLSTLKKLRFLSLISTTTSDVGAKHLESITTLRELYLTKTRVSQTAVEQLGKQLPLCRIR